MTTKNLTMTRTLLPRRTDGCRRWCASSVATAAVLALVGAACGDGTDETRSTTIAAPDTTVSTTTAPASGLKTIDPDALQTLVDTTMQDLLVPGAVVLLRTPQGDFTAAYGTTEIGVDDRPGPDTHFRIASITKTMTSAVILQLAQEGLLRLDDPVSKYVPDVPDGDTITIAELLEMRSGLYSFTDSPALPAVMDADPTRVWTPQELLDIAFAQPSMFPPGSEYYYSNTTTCCWV